MDGFRYWVAQVREFLNVPLLTLGGTQVTLWTVISFIALVVLLFYAARKIRTLLVERLLTRTHLDLGARQAVGAITRYVVLLLGLLIILQTVGINLTTLNVLAGAVGIGIGFGLQNVASNFISGLIILFERPIKVGDRIEVEQIEGQVVEVGARSTKVLTNDNITVIVPNSKFITENVVNWVYRDGRVRFKIPVSVAYGSDVRLVERLLLEVAEESANVLRDPAPVVRFMEFGESGLAFELRAWSTSLVHRKGKLMSELNFAIYDKFVRHEVEMPFPQRDLHIRGGVLEVKGSLSAANGDGAREPNEAGEEVNEAA